MPWRAQASATAKPSIFSSRAPGWACRSCPTRCREALTPATLERLLFDDVPYLKIAQEEHDNFARVLRENGVSCVIASSFARIFYRNAINVGLPVLEIGDDVEKIKAGDVLDVDLSTGKIVDKTTGDVFQAPPLPGFIQDIAKAGGLINYVKEYK